MSPRLNYNNLLFSQFWMVFLVVFPLFLNLTKTQPLHFQRSLLGTSPRDPDQIHGRHTCFTFRINDLDIMKTEIRRPGR